MTPAPVLQTPGLLQPSKPRLSEDTTVVKTTATVPVMDFPTAVRPWPLLCAQQPSETAIQNQMLMFEGIKASEAGRALQAQAWQNMATMSGDMSLANEELMSKLALAEARIQEQQQALQARDISLQKAETALKECRTTIRHYETLFHNKAEKLRSSG